MTSARALGVLTACVYQGIKPTVEAVQAHFKHGGRHMYLVALKELEDAGFISRKKIRIGSDLRTECLVTEQAILFLRGSGFPMSDNLTAVDTSGVGFSDCLLKQSQLVSLDTSYKLESKIWSDEVREEYQTIPLQVESHMEEEVPYEFFESNVTSEHVAERQLDLQKAKAKHDERKREAQANKTKKIIRRQDMPQSLWTCADIAYEFSYRLEFYWNIPPWAIKSTKFVQAIGNMRSRLDTNGEIEFKMLDLFFDSVNFEKYTSADPVWRLFIARGDELAAKAKGMVRSDEDLEEAVSQAKKSQEWLYE
jgi:hypothetical protein